MTKYGLGNRDRSLGRTKFLRLPQLAKNPASHPVVEDSAVVNLMQDTEHSHSCSAEIQQAVNASTEHLLGEIMTTCVL